MKYLVLPLLTLMLSCHENADPELSARTIFLEGKWVETENRQDTIIFYSNVRSNDRQIFSFRSNDEINGYNQLYTTVFEFKISGDKISLYNVVSSCYCFEDYSFSVRGDHLNIGNFYDAGREGKSEIFVRLK